MRNKPDIKYLGREPELTSTSPEVGKFAEILNWYNHFYGHDDEEIYEWMKEFLLSKGKPKGEVSTYVLQAKFPKTLCFLARLLNRGLNGAKYEERILHHFEVFITHKHKRQQRYSKAKNARKDNLLVADIDEALDTLYNSKYRKTPSTEFLSVLTKYPSQQIRAAKKHVEEIYEELSSKDPQVKEAYSHLSKRALTNYVHFVKDIMAKIEQGSVNARRQAATARKSPTKKKKKGSDLSKLKRQFFDDNTGVHSASASGIDEASVIYLYNTKYRDLRRLVAGENGFHIKGTTIHGFDPVQSSQKKLRHPKEVVSEISTSTKKSCERCFRSVKSKEQKTNGRSNDHTIIVKIIK